MLRQRLELDHQGYLKSLKEAERAMKRFADEGGRQGKRSAEETERAWTRSTQRMGTALRGLQTLILTVFSVQAVSRFTSALIDANSNLEQLRLRFTALTGSAQLAGETLDKIEKFAQAKGLRFEPLARAVQTMTAMGLELGTIMDNLDALSAGALLSPNGLEAGFEAIGRALGQMASSGAVAKEELNQLRDAGVPALQLLADQLGRTTTEIEEMISRRQISSDVGVQAILQGLRENYGALVTEYEKSGDAAGNRFKDAFRDALTGIGGELFEEITRDLQRLTVSLDAPGRGSALREIGSALTDIYRVLRDIASVVVPMIPTLVRFGAAFAAVKLIETPFVRAAAAARKFGSEVKTAFANYRGEVTGFVKRMPDGSTAMSGADIGAFLSGDESLRRRMQDVERSRSAMDRARIATRNYGRALANLGRDAGRALVSFVGLNTIYTAIAAAVGYLAYGFYRTATASDAVTKAILEQKKAVDELQQSIKSLEGAQLVSERSRILKDTLVKAIETLPPLPVGIEIDIENLDEAKAQIKQQIDLQRSLIDNPALRPPGFDADASRTLIERLQAVLSLIASTNSVVGKLDDEIGKSLTAQLALEEERLQQMRDRVQLTGEEKKRIGELQDERKRILDDANLSEAAAKRAADAVDAQIKAINEAARARLPKAELEAQERRVELLKEEARARGLIASAGTTSAPPSPKDTARATLEELNHRIAILKTERELRSQMEEILRLEAEQSELAKQIGTAKGAELDAAREAHRLVSEELSERRSALETAREHLQIYQALPLEARRLVDELGGLDELLKTLSREGVESLLPNAASVGAALEKMQREMAERMANLQYRRDMNLVSEEDARREAERFAVEFARALDAALAKIDLKSLPEPIRKYIEELRNAIAGMIGANKSDAAQQEAEEWRQLADEVERAADGVRRLIEAGRALSQVAVTFGRLGRAAEGFVSGLFEALEALEKMKRVQAEIGRINATRAADGLGPLSAGQEALMGAPVAAAIATGLFSAATSITSSIEARRKEAIEQARRHQEEMRRISDSLRAYQQQIRQSIERLFGGGRTGDSVRPSDIAAAKDVVDAARAFLFELPVGPRGTPGPTTPGQRNQAHELLADLDDLGIFDVDLTDLLETLLDSGLDLRGAMNQILFGDRSGRGTGFEGVNAILTRLESELGSFTKDVEGAVDAVSFFARFMGEDAVAQFDRFLSLLLDSGSDLFKKLDDDFVSLLKEAQGLDLATGEGRARLEEIIRVAAIAFSQFKGDMTAGELEALFAELENLDLMNGELRALAGELKRLDVTTDEGKARLDAIVQIVVGALSGLRGDLTNEELEALLSELKRLADDAESAGGGDEFSQSVSYLRQITTAQGSEIVFLLREISHTLRTRLPNQNVITPNVPQIPVPSGPKMPGTPVPRTSGISISVGDVTAMTETDIKNVMSAIEREIRREALRAY